MRVLVCVSVVVAQLQRAAPFTVCCYMHRCPAGGGVRADTFISDVWQFVPAAGSGDPWGADLVYGTWRRVPTALSGHNGGAPAGMVRSAVFLQRTSTPFSDDDDYASGSGSDSDSGNSTRAVTVDRIIAVEAVADRRLGSRATLEAVYELRIRDAGGDGFNTTGLWSRIPTLGYACGAVRHRCRCAVSLSLVRVSWYLGVLVSWCVGVLVCVLVCWCVCVYVYVCWTQARSQRLLPLSIVGCRCEG